MGHVRVNAHLEPAQSVAVLMVPIFNGAGQSLAKKKPGQSLAKKNRTTLSHYESSPERVQLNSTCCRVNANHCTFTATALCGAFLVVCLSIVVVPISGSNARGWRVVCPAPLPILGMGSSKKKNRPWKVFRVVRLSWVLRHTKGL